MTRAQIHEQRQIGSVRVTIIEVPVANAWAVDLIDKFGAHTSFSRRERPCDHQINEAVGRLVRWSMGRTARN